LAAEFYRGGKLFDKGVSALKTVKFLNELSLRVVDRKPVHPAEPIRDIWVWYRMLSLYLPLKAKRDPIVDQDQSKSVV